MGQPLLGPDEREDLGVGVELHAEPAAEPLGDGPAELGHAVVRRVAVGGGVARSLPGRLHHVVWRGRVRVPHAEGDDVRAGGTPLGHLPVELGEQVRRQVLHAPGDPHPHASSRAASRRPVWISPSYTRTAGPRIVTGPSGSHSTSTAPPGKWTRPRRPVIPARCAATSDAHAPVPQAMVSPTPRSHTRTRTPSSAGATNSTLVRLGNRGSRSSIGPIRPTST